MAVDRLAMDRPSSTAHAHDDLVERLDAQVRERVRREGVDPQREALVVRRIAEDVVRDHDDLSLTGAVAPIADDGAMVGELVARISGFGCSPSSTTLRSRRCGSTPRSGCSSPAAGATS